MKITLFTRQCRQLSITDEHVITFGYKKIKSLEQLENALRTHEITEVMDNSTELEYYDAVNMCLQQPGVAEFLEMVRRDNLAIFAKLHYIWQLTTWEHGQRHKFMQKSFTTNVKKKKVLNRAHSD